MKLKSHKGMLKRIRKTKNGKLKRRSAYISHLLSDRKKSRKRRHSNYQDISKADRKQVKKLLPYR
jgi:large subunit ribosomal protein L35